MGFDLFCTFADGIDGTADGAKDVDIDGVEGIDNGWDAKFAGIGTVTDAVLLYWSDGNAGGSKEFVTGSKGLTASTAFCCAGAVEFCRSGLSDALLLDLT